MDRHEISSLIFVLSWSGISFTTPFNVETVFCFVSGISRIEFSGMKQKSEFALNIPENKISSVRKKVERKFSLLFNNIESNKRIKTIEININGLNIISAPIIIPGIKIRVNLKAGELYISFIGKHDQFIFDQIFITDHFKIIHIVLFYQNANNYVCENIKEIFKDFFNRAVFSNLQLRKISMPARLFNSCSINKKIEKKDNRNRFSRSAHSFFRNNDPSVCDPVFL